MAVDEQASSAPLATSKPLGNLHQPPVVHPHQPVAEHAVCKMSIGEFGLTHKLSCGWRGRRIETLTYLALC